MKILAIDTSSKICSVSILENEQVILEKRNDDEKKYGIQIDALADIVSFGILPTIIGFAIYSDAIFQNNDIFSIVINIIIFSSYVLAALIRLAYFNVGEMKLQDNNVSREYYEGLPVTSVALIIPLVYSICIFFNISAYFSP